MEDLNRPPMVNTPSSFNSVSASRNSVLPNTGKALLALSMLLGSTGCGVKATNQIKVTRTVESEERESQIMAKKLEAFSTLIDQNDKHTKGHSMMRSAEIDMKNAKHELERLSETSKASSFTDAEIAQLKGFFEKHGQDIDGVLPVLGRRLQSCVITPNQDELKVTLEFHCKKSDVDSRYEMSFLFDKKVGYIPGSVAFAADFDVSKYYITSSDEELKLLLSSSPLEEK